MKPIRPLVYGRDPIVVSPTTSVQQAARVMTERQIGAVPVTDGNSVSGIFSERDLMTRVVAAGLDPATTSVGAVMSTELVTANVNELHGACIRRMQQARVRHLLVLDDDRLVGVLSLRDLVALELEEREEAITLLNAYVAS
jgi:CBS domain-containing protein